MRYTVYAVIVGFMHYRQYDTEKFPQSTCKLETLYNQPYTVVIVLE